MTINQNQKLEELLTRKIEEAFPSDVFKEITIIPVLGVNFFKIRITEEVEIHITKEGNFNVVVFLDEIGFTFLETYDRIEDAVEQLQIQVAKRILEKELQDQIIFDELIFIDIKKHNLPDNSIETMLEFIAMNGDISTIISTTWHVMKYTIQRTTRNIRTHATL